VPAAGPRAGRGGGDGNGGDRVMTDTSIEWTDATWDKFVALIAIGDPDACWEWTAGRFTNGYGQFRVGKRKVRAHRAYYERVVGPVPDGLILRHSCDNRPCCNPKHLIPGTHADNAADRESRGRGARNGTSLPGVCNPAAKLDPVRVAEALAMHAQGATLVAVARAFGISPSQAGNIVHGRSWRAA
jgi:hypothetical protein